MQTRAHVNRRSRKPARPHDTKSLLAFRRSRKRVSNSRLILMSKQGERLALSSCRDHFVVTFILHTKCPKRVTFLHRNHEEELKEAFAGIFPIPTVNKGSQKNPPSNSWHWNSFKEKKQMLTASALNLVWEGVRRRHTDGGSIAY